MSEVVESAYQDKPKHPGGRPTSYRTEYAEQAHKYALLGADDKDLALFFDVCDATISNWKNDYPEFLEALKNGKEKADAEIASKLYHRAKGYEFTEEQAFKLKDSVSGEKIEVVSLKKEIPPDPTSMIFWLKNRRGKHWRDKQDVDLTSKGEAVKMDIMEAAKVMAFVLTGGTPKA